MERSAKIYCERCDLVFETRKKFEAHFASHSSAVSCEACPIDMALSRLASLFRRTFWGKLE